MNNHSDISLLYSTIYRCYFLQSNFYGRSTFGLFFAHPSFPDIQLSDNIEGIVESAVLQAIMDYGNTETIISLDLIHTSSQNDQNYTTLVNSIEQGFPNRHSLIKPMIYNFWEVWHLLSTDRGLLLMKGRIVVPKSLKGKISRYLHSVHQGVVCIKTHANDSVFWLGMNVSICNFRPNCIVCLRMATSQPRDPITITPSPDWLFQKIVMGLFYIEQFLYLICIDRLNN